MKKLKTIDILVAIARGDQRCPPNRELCTSEVANLIHRGIIRTLHFSNNFRQVEFVAGRYKGLKTSGPDIPGEPWRIVDKSTIGRHGRTPRRAAMHAHPVEIFGGFDDAELARKLAASEFKADDGGNHDLAATPSGPGEGPYVCVNRATAAATPA